MESLNHALEAIIARGDLAHLVLSLWALGASALSFALLRSLTDANKELTTAAREVSDANRHVKEFVRELTRFNERNAGPREEGAQ